MYPFCPGAVGHDGCARCYVLRHHRYRQRPRRGNSTDADSRVRASYLKSAGSGRDDTTDSPRSSRTINDQECEAGYRGHEWGSIQLRLNSPYVRLPTCETGSLETASSATQSRGCSHRGSPPFSRCMWGAFGGRGRSAGETRDDRGEVAAGLQEIVSRAGFRGPGWALPGHPPAEGGWWIGPPPGRMLSPG